MLTENSPKVGDTILVKVTCKNEYGVFVKMPNGNSGLIRPFEISRYNKQYALSRISVGDKMEVKVKDELPDGKLVLSRKSLLPRIETLEEGDIVSCEVKSLTNIGLFVYVHDFVALIPKAYLYSYDYSLGEKLEAVVLNKSIDEEGYVKLTLSVKDLFKDFLGKHSVGDNISCKYCNMIPTSKGYKISVILDNFKIDVKSSKIIEPFRSQLEEGSVAKGTNLEFIISNIDLDTKQIYLDMHPIEEFRRIEYEKYIASQLVPGNYLGAEVLKVDDRRALVKIDNTEAICVIPREELSPNKIVSAADEVFVGERLDVVYMGFIDDHLKFSRRLLEKDKYDESLYDLSLSDLLSTMDIHTTRFVGEVICVKDTYFFSNLMTCDTNDSQESGKLLIDPVNGKSLIVLLDNRLRNFVCEGNFYEVNVDVASKVYRKKEGTPYMFHVVSNDIKEVNNPYKESVTISFKQHTSPNTNTSVANLLEEVGQNLYTSKKRMFFELLQNADDASAKNGVKVKLQLCGQYFVLSHDGYAFNRHDFESLTSAAKSTKSANKKKTGYKGIGFKSVFTNSCSVFIKSGGYEFAFNKNLDIYNNFKDFYFLVNEFEGDEIKQEKFLYKYSKYYREFKGVKDIPWQLLPVWNSGFKINDVNSIFNKNENVAIALEMGTDTLVEYGEAVKEVFEEPRFMLFLRNTTRIQFIRDNECYTIQKNILDGGNKITLVNSFKQNDYKDSYCIYTIDNIEINDQAFKRAGIPMKREERINNGEKENYFVKVNENGSAPTEVSGIPDRISSATETSLSFAIKLDDYGHVSAVSKEDFSLYAYLPMNEYRFKFPFFINADFIPKSDREGVQSDNPWNHFLFYIIGASIVSMVSSKASSDESEYLNLLPSKVFESTTQDTSLLVTAFNTGYLNSLINESFILNDKDEIVGCKDIVYDESNLSEYIGSEQFYLLIGTEKRLPHPNIDSTILSNSIFGIEKVTVSKIVKEISDDLQGLTSWIASTTDDARNKFFEWLTINEVAQTLIPEIPIFCFGNSWYSIVDLQNENKENYIITTELVNPVKSILEKLGFVCSSNILDEHPLVGFVANPNEKCIFEKIKARDITNLTFAERLALFKQTAKFDEIGKETLGKWPIFKNQLGQSCALSSMFAYNETHPVWLYDYMLCKDESVEDLEKYLVATNNIYSSIIEKNIDKILQKTDIPTIFYKYKTDWQAKFTSTLIAKKVSNIISVVEQSGDDIKEEFLKSLTLLTLSTNDVYGKTSDEYRIIKMVSAVPSCLQYVRSIISVDGIKLTNITVTDTFNVLVQNIKYPFCLSKILLAYSSSSILEKIISSFHEIPGSDAIFAQNEASVETVYINLCTHIRSNNQLLTAEQFCFLLMYRASHGYSSFINNEIPLIRINSISLFTQILDRCLVGNLGKFLDIFINNTKGVNFPCGRLKGKYLDCDNFTLPSERVPQFIQDWAISSSQKNFLSTLGVLDASCLEMKRRISFSNSKLENLWDISDSSIITSFYTWVRGTFKTPIVEGNQLTILETLSKRYHLTKSYIENHFKDFKEWNNERYLEWKISHGITIYIINGLLPYRAYFQEYPLFESFMGEYVFFKDSNHLYLSSNREPEILLAEIYSNNSCPFTKDDWNSIFLVSADLVREKDERIAELERLLAQSRKNQKDEYDVEVDEHGEYTQKDENDEQTRYEINREARFAAKDYLECHSDFDSSQWNPENSKHLVINQIKYKGKPIVVAILSSQKSKLYLHPRAFAELMEDPDNLLLNYGPDKEIHSLSFADIFMDNPNVNLIFDTDVVSPSEIASLANKYMGSKKTCFVIENPRYSQSDELQSFGLNEKKEDGTVALGFSLDDLFGF